jgi:NAD(P)-dependent dehydrogenase (short-subunit alcohol dehydrogenase family)
MSRIAPIRDRRLKCTRYGRVAGPIALGIAAGVSKLAMSGALSGQVAVVTGVSRAKGIGAAIARELAKHGANLFLTGWQEYDDQQPSETRQNEPLVLVEELRKLGVEAEWTPVDLSLTEAPRKLWDAVQARFGVAQILVNNACFWARDSFETLAAETLDRHYALNTRAPVLLSVEFVRRFGGKGARQFLSRFALGRLGQPEDAAHLIAFLAGPEGGWITGQVLRSRGGFE